MEQSSCGAVPLSCTLEMCCPGEPGTQSRAVLPSRSLRPRTMQFLQDVPLADCFPAPLRTPDRTRPGNEPVLEWYSCPSCHNAPVRGDAAHLCSVLIPPDLAASQPQLPTPTNRPWCCAWMLWDSASPVYEEKARARLGDVQHQAQGQVVPTCLQGAAGRTAANLGLFLFQPCRSSVCAHCQALAQLSFCC